MVTTFTLEAHELNTRTGLHCDCGAFQRVEVDVAIVDPSTLTVLRRVTGSLCPACGDAD